MNRSTQLAQEALDRQGFVVMAWRDGPEPLPKIGDVRPGPFRVGNSDDQVMGPLVIVGHASREDWFRQGLAAGYLPQEPPNVLAYFKMVAE